MKTNAIAEQAEAVEYLTACRDGQFGAYGVWLVEEYFPKGLNLYPAGDQIGCASRIMGYIASYETSGDGFGPFGKQRTPEERKAIAAKDALDLMGPA